MSAVDPNNIAALTNEGRDHMGRFLRNIETAERDVQAARLKKLGYTYRQIGEYFGVSGPTAYAMVQRIMRETVQEAADDVRQMELERLDAALVRLEHSRLIAVGLLERKHVVVSNGRIIGRRVGWELDGDGEPIFDADGRKIPIYEDLEDDSAILQILDRLNGIEDRIHRNMERRAKYLGIDAPTRISVDAENLGREIAELFGAVSSE